jgi:hypothetical protein
VGQSSKDESDKAMSDVNRGSKPIIVNSAALDRQR